MSDDEKVQLIAAGAVIAAGIFLIAACCWVFMLYVGTL